MNKRRMTDSLDKPTGRIVARGAPLVQPSLEGFIRSFRDDQPRACVPAVAADRVRRPPHEAHPHADAAAGTLRWRSSITPADRHRRVRRGMRRRASELFLGTGRTRPSTEYAIRNLPRSQRNRSAAGRASDQHPPLRSRAAVGPPRAPTCPDQSVDRKATRTGDRESQKRDQV